jgi:hypothetical protein
VTYLNCVVLLDMNDIVTRLANSELTIGQRIHDLHHATPTLQHISSLHTLIKSDLRALKSLLHDAKLLAYEQDSKTDESALLSTLEWHEQEYERYAAHEHLPTHAPNAEYQHQHRHCATNSISVCNVKRVKRRKQLTIVWSNAKSVSDVTCYLPQAQRRNPPHLLLQQQPHHQHHRHHQQQQQRRQQQFVIGMR